MASYSDLTLPTHLSRLRYLWENPYFQISLNFVNSSQGFSVKSELFAKKAHKLSAMSKSRQGEFVCQTNFPCLTNSKGALHL